MKCEKCGKFDANTHITKVINGIKTEMHLCPQCAGESQEFFSFKSSFDQDFDSLFSGFWHTPQLGQSEFSQSTASDCCNLCGTRLVEFLKTGKPGCTNCYNIFSKYLMRPLRQIHGSAKHIGKIPSRTGKEIKIASQLEQLQNSLNAAVSQQNFEEAARLRDEINRLKG